MRGMLAKIAAAMLVAVVLTSCLWYGVRFLQRDYVFWNGSLLPREAQSLDISGKKLRSVEAFLEFSDLRSLDARGTGMTAEQYDWFRRELPDCRVLWDIPIQGSHYSQDIRTLRVDSLTPEETELLAHFSGLKELDVGRWGDYARIAALQQQDSNRTVRCQVELAGEWWDNDVVSLVIADADAQELLERLPCFYRLESVMLTGKLPGLEELSALQERFPQVFFLWKMKALGMTLETDMTSLNLSHLGPEALEEAAALLPYFPKLETVMLNSQGAQQEALLALAAEYPEIHFVFDLTFGEHTLRTDAQEIDISNTLLESTAEVEAILPCFRNLQKVVMCQCGISDEDMDALNRKYADIRFVWSVDLGGMLFRTDAVHFTPNRWGLSLDDADVYPLRYCTDMVCVDIGHNMKVTNCEWAAFMPDLKYLVLAETGISDLSPLENHENLVFLEIFLSRVTDYSPLLTCKTLEDLNLCYTYGSWEPIAQMTWLKRLWWSGSWAARTALADKLPDTYAEYLSLSSTGRGWREGQHYYDMRDFIGMEYMVG